MMGLFHVHCFKSFGIVKTRILSDFLKRTKLYLRPKVTLHCYYIYLFWVLVSGILNVFNSY